MLQIQKNTPLSQYTTFQTGGPAEYFCVVQNQAELVQALKYAKKNKLDYLILGKGSNLLINDHGFPGLAIKLENKKIKVKNNIIYAEAGASLQDLVKTSAKNNLSGLEWAAGIPGTLGGAVRGNAGAFKGSIADIVTEVEVLNNQKIEKFKNKACSFAYRNSIFKEKPSLIVLSAKLKLKKANQQKIQVKIKECLDYRKTHHPLEYPSAGSIFKNIYQTKHPTAKMQKFLKQLGFIPAGWLIEESGLKNLCLGGACIAGKHSNFIINKNCATAQNIYDLIEKIQEKVYNKFRIKLEPEIQFIGF